MNQKLTAFERCTARGKEVTALQSARARRLRKTQSIFIDLVVKSEQMVYNKHRRKAWGARYSCYFEPTLL